MHPGFHIVLFASLLYVFFYLFIIIGFIDDFAFRNYLFHLLHLSFIHILSVLRRRDQKVKAVRKTLVDDSPKFAKNSESPFLCPFSSKYMFFYTTNVFSIGRTFSAYFLMYL